MKKKNLLDNLVDIYSVFFKVAKYHKTEKDCHGSQKGLMLKRPHPCGIVEVHYMLHV